MLFRQLFDAESSTYTYLVADESTRQAVLIDPVIECVDRDRKLLFELGLDLVYAMDTHIHADHVTGAGTLRHETGAKVVSSKRGAPGADLHVGPGDVIRVGRLAIGVLATPGHTDDSVSYLLEDRVFTGDALFIRGCGRTDFQNGDPTELYTSITKVLFALLDSMLVYPSHDYRGHTVSTIGEEKRWNPRVAGKTEREFVSVMRALKLPVPKRIQEAVPRNLACGVVESRETGSVT